MSATSGTPSLDEVLFARGHPDWEMNACLHFDPEGWVGYIEGYRMAGDILVDRVRATRGDQDFLVYPIVFVYRHYVELSLKHLRELLLHLEDQSVRMSNEHDLRVLWQECRVLLEKVFPDEPRERLDVAGSIVQQLGGVDERSFAFRYPGNQEGASYIPGDLVLFNLGHFSKQIGKLADLFAGYSEAATVYLQDKREMESEYGP
jgi:hypothetical protein